MFTSSLSPAKGEGRDTALYEGSVNQAVLQNSSFFRLDLPDSFAWGTLSTCLLSSPDLGRSSMFVRIQVHGFCNRQLSNRLLSLFFHPSVHRTSSAGSVLLGVSGTSRYHYEGWIYGGAEYKHIAPLAINRAKKRGQRKYCWSRGLRINHLHGSVSPFAVVKQLSEGCAFDAITIPCPNFEWVSVNDAHGMLTKRWGSLVNTLRAAGQLE